MGTSRIYHISMVRQTHRKFPIGIAGKSLFNSSCILDIYRWNIYRAAKCNEVANKLTAPNMFIGYRIALYCMTSVSASNVQKLLKQVLDICQFWLRFDAENKYRSMKTQSYIGWTTRINDMRGDSGDVSERWKNYR